MTRDEAITVLLLSGVAMGIGLYALLTLDPIGALLRRLREWRS